jgi:Na+-transporting NADH:ubiquinone oxidoreductase subunit NqrF
MTGSFLTRVGYIYILSNEEDMQIKLPDQSEIFSQGKVVMHEMLNHSTLLLKVECQDIKEYFAGQFVNLQRDDGLIRSYSIANVPQQDGILEFHIRLLTRVGYIYILSNQGI